MNRMHALLPLTEQEERVEGILLQYGITRLTHAAFPVKGRAYVVDFYLPRQPGGDRVLAELEPARDSPHLDGEKRGVRGLEVQAH